MDTKVIIPRNDLQIRRSYLVEVPITDTSINAKPEFQRDNVLNPKTTGSVIFTGMEVIYNGVLAVAPSGRTTINPTEAGLLNVTLLWQDDEFIRQQPLISLIPAVNFGMIRRLDKRKIELTKSYLTVVGAGIAANKSALFQFYYLDPVKDADILSRMKK